MADKVIRLDRQLKYQGTILKIYEDTVLANGHEAHWDFIHHDGAAAVVPVTDDGRILMVRQYRNALDRGTLENLISVNTTVAFCDEAIDIFVARNLIPSHQHLDEDEVIEVEAWQPDDLLKLIYEGKMTDGKTVAAICAYAAKYR